MADPQTQRAKLDIPIEALDALMPTGPLTPTTPMAPPARPTFTRTAAPPAGPAPAVPATGGSPAGALPPIASPPPAASLPPPVGSHLQAVSDAPQKSTLQKIGGTLGRIGGVALSALAPGVAQFIPSTPLGKITGQSRELRQEGERAKISQEGAQGELAKAGAGRDVAETAKLEQETKNIAEGGGWKDVAGSEVIDDTTGRIRVTQQNARGDNRQVEVPFVGATDASGGASAPAGGAPVAPGTAAAALAPSAVPPGIPAGAAPPAAKPPAFRKLGTPPKEVDEPVPDVNKSNAAAEKAWQSYGNKGPLSPEFVLPPGATRYQESERDKAMDFALRGAEVQKKDVENQQDKAWRRRMEQEGINMRKEAADEKKEKAELKWVQGTDAEGRTVAMPLSQAKKEKLENMAELAGPELHTVQDSRAVVQLAEKRGDKPDRMGVEQLIESLDKDGKLGVLSSRMNAFLEGKVGILPDDDPRIAALLNKTDLMMTASMKAHFGASGGRSPQMLAHFLDMANAKKMTGPALMAGTKAVADYMRDRGMMSAPAAQSSGGDTGVTVTAGGKSYSFPDQKAADAFKKEAGIK